jgi:DNA mismatch repair ATPase MutS
MPKNTIKEKYKELHFSSTTAKTERYTTFTSERLTLELIQQEESMDEALEPFLNSIIQHFALFKQYWTQVAEVYSELDVLYSLAQVSR